MNDDLLAHLVKPLSFDELHALTDLSGPQLMGAMRALERDGKVRFTRGLYERTYDIVAIENQHAEPILSPVTKTPEPPRAAVARPAAIAAIPAQREDETMAKKVCSSGTDCVEGRDPKPASAFYGNDSRCKKCRLRLQRDAKLARTNGAAAPKAGKASPPPQACRSRTTTRGGDPSRRANVCTGPAAAGAAALRRTDREAHRLHPRPARQRSGARGRDHAVPDGPARRLVAGAATHRHASMS